VTGVAVNKEPTTGEAVKEEPTTGIPIQDKTATGVSAKTCHDTLRLLLTSLIMNDPRSQVKSDILAQLKALADSS